MAPWGAFVTDTLYEYDGVLAAPSLASRSTRVVAEAARIGLSVEVFGDLLELRYSGRDHNRSVREFLRALASIIGHADGEIACTISDDSGADPRLEFYSCEDGELYVQEARVVREARRLADRGSDAGTPSTKGRS